jgi:Malectin domain
MSSPAVESVSTELERAELQAVLHSQLFVRSPTLAHLLSYLCEKKFAGESDQIKEYSVALDAFGRRDSFDQDTDSIVRVQANRLRKRLTEYYAGEGAAHRVQITIPVGQYVPVFAEKTVPEPSTPQPPQARSSRLWMVLPAASLLILLGALAFLQRDKLKPARAPLASGQPQTVAAPVGLPVGDELRILAGASRSYVDRAGKQWNPDSYFTGGAAVRSPIQHIWRTQDASIYRNSRQGDFAYNIPLKPGTYELHLYFAETFYGPEGAGGGGEGSRVMAVSANGRPLLTDFDALADSGSGRTADVKVFTDITPADDGMLHLSFSSVRGGRGMLSAIEILPGTPGRMRPVRIVARDVPYYSNDSHWWSSDNYFKGGQLGSSEDPAGDTDDPELYETDRWGHFSYAIPVTPGKYTVTLHFIERRLDLANRQEYARSTSDPRAASEARTFDVFCNGKAILRDLDVVQETGENRPLVRKIAGLEPNAQGTLLLEFVPVNGYATVTAIEVVPQ